MALFSVLGMALSFGFSKRLLRRAHKLWPELELGMALFAVLGMALSSSCSRRWSNACSRRVDLCFAVRCTENSVPSAAVLVRAELYLEFNRDFEDYETILNKNLHHLAQILCQYEN